MTSLLAELKRRNVYKVAFAYLILGWLVLQITDVVAPALFLPDWTMTLVTFLGIIGFPFAMLFTWAFELTPDGLKRAAEVKETESITGETGKTLNGLIIAMMAMAITFLLVDRFLLDEPGATSGEIAGNNYPPADSEQNAADKPRSIAVLPFVNMSKDPDQEYFSDGISEELLNGLAKISELRVAARTSSFAFKNKNEDITGIGQQLNVETVLEGSVRKSGTRVRITAQLINVADGYHLWSETYDRELTDIFTIQDEISGAIVEALKVHLTDADVVATTGRPDNLEAYNFFLLARHSLRQRTEASLRKALSQYQKAIDIDPAYAAAWAGKATASELLSERHYGKVPPLEAARTAQQLVDMALRLDPGNADALATQALLDLNHADAHSAVASLEQAIAANPSEGVLYSWLADALDDVGRWQDSQQAIEKSFQLDPLHRITRRNLAMRYAFTGKSELAREMVSPGEQAYFEIEGFIALSEGRYADRERILTEGIATVSQQESRILSFMRANNRFWDLYALEQAYDGASETQKIRFDAALDAERALAEIASLNPDRHGRRVQRSEINALLKLQRYDEVLQRLAAHNMLHSPLWGSIGGGGAISQFYLAIDYALGLKRLGRNEDARLLAQRLQAYIDEAVANGQPPNYFRQQAAVQAIMDDLDGAMGSLRIAEQEYDLSWRDLNGPWFEELRDREDFQLLFQAHIAHLNNERAKLGWTPVEVSSL